MKKIFGFTGLFLITLLAGVWLTGAAGLADDTPADSIKPEPSPGRALARQAVRPQNLWTTTDHSRHLALQKEFRQGEDITAACISCHSEAESQFQKTIHWTWIGYTDANGKRLGKAGDSLNNFCLSSNNMQDKGCLSCHPGWDGQQSAVNCLACHSQNNINYGEAFEDYNAFVDSDEPDEQELAQEIQANLHRAAQSIGRPTRQNCGECHFKGGGGDGVKHGDLDTSLTKPNKALDVHMGLDGQNFECTRCHTTVQHNVAGRIYSKPAATERKSLIQDDLTPKIMCESCHGSTPHETGHKANDHTDKVACQSCHIPTFARVNATKMSWDWSQAGRLKEGKPYKETGALGKEDYLSIKGAMTWAKDVTPQYFWFNGAMHTLTVKDIVDPATVVAVSAPVGSPDDPQSRIFPFKVHMGRQPYDKVHKTLLAPLLSGQEGYWNTLDWPSALAKGQAALNVPFSGEYDFVDSSYFFPTTHMVAPKQNVVGCAECHVRETGRLANVAGVYMPGRDRINLLDTLGWMAVLGSLLGVTLHGLGRIFSGGRKET
jgi:octaheme c-type cytochrome (tetrathionate reductase family)